jgi:metal-responsive CopG/Arc/MetJ family transcriptional regulator
MRGKFYSHFKVICISLYNEDLKRLDEMVRILKDERGLTLANRSSLIRYALRKINVNEQEEELEKIFKRNG